MKYSSLFLVLLSTQGYFSIPVPPFDSLFEYQDTDDVEVREPDTEPYMKSKSGIEIPQPGWTCQYLEKGSLSIILHGTSGLGKSKIVEDLAVITSRCLAGLKAGEGVTKVCTDYVYEHPDTHNKLHILDTPGFGESKEECKKLIWEGLDGAYHKAKELRHEAPLKRIYILVDFEKIPETVKYLEAMSFVYGKDALKKVTVILNKCDTIAWTKEYEEKIKNEINKSMKKYTGNDKHNILMISAVKCIIQLSEDLIKAQEEKGCMILPERSECHKIYQDRIADFDREMDSYIEECNDIQEKINEINERVERCQVNKEMFWYSGLLIFNLPITLPCYLTLAIAESVNKNDLESRVKNIKELDEKGNQNRKEKEKFINLVS